MKSDGRGRMSVYPMTLDASSTEEDTEYEE
jgi:hypothetical protein